jgi:hypothetical protein
MRGIFGHRGKQVFASLNLVSVIISIKMIGISQFAVKRTKTNLAIAIVYTVP